jgi:multidrug efflux pump subunit AcrB
MAKKSIKHSAKRTWLQRMTLYFFDRPRRTALVACAIAVFGFVCFTTLMRREGFPNVSVPYAAGQAVYIANDAAAVDREVAKPLSLRIAKEADVKSVTTTAQANYVTVVVQYQNNVDAEVRTKALTKQIEKEKLLPAQAKLSLAAAKYGFTLRGDDAVLSLYNVKEPAMSTAELAAASSSAVSFVDRQNSSQIKNVSLINPIELAVNPLSGETVQTQTKFERFVVREGGKTTNYHAVAIGVQKASDADVLKLDADLHSITQAYNAKHSNDGYRLAISGSYAVSVRQQMNELGKTLLEGLIAVLIIGSIVIAVRASFITVISMVTVILSSFALLHTIGYTLNTIVLFSLILALALIVDDTIIMVEAIDKERHRTKDKHIIITSATKKVAQAMIAATTTAALSFAPLFFVGGVIGDFVRAVPVTIISALVISLIVALVVIPLLTRVIMLRPKQLGRSAHRERAAEIETKIARFISAPILWARGVRKREIAVGLTAILISLGFIAAGAALFTKVTFNIFPPAKDGNEIAVTLTFPADTSIAKAEELTDKAVKQVASALGNNLDHTANFGAANASSARFDVYLTDYSKRDVSSHDLVEKVKHAFQGAPEGVTATAQTVEIAPASSFEARIDAEENREAATRLATDIAAYLKTADITRIDGSAVKFSSVTVEGTATPLRSGGKSYVAVAASFVDDDTTTQINRTKAAIAKEFTPARVASYGLSKTALSYEFGLEEQNQSSFASLLLAFPVVLAIIFVVLALQFRSFIQPLLIFMAVPFSIFGVMVGLYLTDNAFSFFAMLGFFALIGLSIKNTILLTDYANQARRAGRSPVDAIHDALAERFRPLVATSLTAIVSLVPLAVASPFWQGLVVVLIGGLLSSTFLVITVFPYYYLGGEFIRLKAARRRKG